jgi:hypothetical protein
LKSGTDRKDKPPRKGGKEIKMTVYADDWLELYIPRDLLDEVEYYSDGGHGYKCGSVFAMKHDETANYIMSNRDSQLAKHFVDDGGIDLDNRAEVIKHIDYINRRMGEDI